MVWVLLVHWTSHACLILSCLSLLPSLALGHLIKPRETLLTGVCEGVNGSNYQNYVGYNPGKSYYRDGNMIGIYTLISGSRSLSKCAQLCGMDWETLSLPAGDPSSIVEEPFTSQQLCEAFVFNPQTSKCILLSGLSRLNLRDSTRYYSGYMACPEPVSTLSSTIVQPPGGVTVVTDCLSIPKSIILNWEGVAAATGYIINCITDNALTMPITVSTTGTTTTISSIVASTNYRCYVSSYTYTALSKGSASTPEIITSCAA